jgi:hypothetical protein
LLSDGGEKAPGGEGTADLVLGAALLVGTAAYVWTWPRDLVGLDEGLFVYESSRIASGAVPYRDFFEIVTPGAWYLMAFLFRLFATDMATARAAMAAVHGLIVLLTFAGCRRLGVRKDISTAAAAFHLAACYPAFTVATPHWFSTLLALAAFHGALGYLSTPSLRRAGAVGALGGLAVAVQQQKGLYLLAALTLVAAIVPRERRKRRVPDVVGVAALLAGAALVLVPGAAYLAARAGLPELYHDLVRIPFTGYRDIHANIQWGQHYPGPTHHPFPGVMKCLPILIPLLALRAYAARTSATRARVLLLVGFCVVTLLGALYNPDYTHLAMAAPPYAIGAAELLEWSLGHRSTSRAGRVVAPVASGLLLVVFAAQMWQTRELRWRLYSVHGRTGFGAIDFVLPNELAQIQALDVLAHAEPAAEFFVYPHHAAVYLMIGKRNPTRYQVLLQGYTQPEQLQEVIAALESRQVRYVALMAQTHSRPIPEFARYLRSHYRRVSVGRFEAKHSFLYERVDAGKAAEPAGAAVE